MILPYLILGGGRYLSTVGDVVRTNLTDDQVAAYTRISADFDADYEGSPGPAERLTEARRGYWEAAARKGGHTLTDLLGR